MAWEDHDEDEWIEIEATIVHQTEKAWLLNDGIQKVWVPKSYSTDNGDGTFSMPEWLAQDKGLI